jgi:hypothetical protein
MVERSIPARYSHLQIVINHLRSSVLGAMCRNQIHRGVHFSDVPRPQAVNEDSQPIIRIRRIIDPLYLYMHGCFVLTYLTCNSSAPFVAMTSISSAQDLTNDFAPSS